MYTRAGDGVIDVSPWFTSREPATEVPVQLVDSKQRPRCGTLFISVRAIRGESVYQQAIAARRASTVSASSARKK